MLGVRFGAVCTIVVGGMLVASAAHAAQTCDSRASRTCRAVAQTNPESRSASSLQRAATARRTRRVARHHRSIRHAQTTSQPRRATEVAAAPAILTRAPESSPAERRFSQFVSPRSLAANPVEGLHKPVMNGSELSGQTAYPVLEVADPQTSAAVDEDRPGLAAVSALDEVQSPASAPSPEPKTTAPPAADTSNQATISTPARADRDAVDGSNSSNSWIRVAFLTWGGLLTLGSALRLLIG